MAKEQKPTLRYFARFKEDFGYLRAVIRYGNVRKYVLTPLVIHRAQLDRLNTAGHIRIETEEDMMLEARLRQYTACAEPIIAGLISTGEFEAFPSEYLTTAIISAYRGQEQTRYQHQEAMAKATYQQKVAEAAARGSELNCHNLQEFKRLKRELKSTLSPEEYAALWEKGGGNDKL